MERTTHSPAGSVPSGRSGVCWAVLPGSSPVSTKSVVPSGRTQSPALPRPVLVWWMSGIPGLNEPDGLVAGLPQYHAHECAVLHRPGCGQQPDAVLPGVPVPVSRFKLRGEAEKASGGPRRFGTLVSCRPVHAVSGRQGCRPLRQAGCLTLRCSVAGTPRGERGASHPQAIYKPPGRQEH